jgi:hypothetical protein
MPRHAADQNESSHHRPAWGGPARPDRIPHRHRQQRVERALVGLLAQGRRLISHRRRLLAQMSRQQRPDTKGGVAPHAHRNRGLRATAAARSPRRQPWLVAAGRRRHRLGSLPRRRDYAARRPADHWSSGRSTTSGDCAPSATTRRTSRRGRRSPTSIRTCSKSLRCGVLRTRVGTRCDVDGSRINSPAATRSSPRSLSTTSPSTPRSGSCTGLF